MPHRDNRIIYEPTGPAREYAALACNIYKGCEHACRYCFGKRRLSPSGKVDYDTSPNPKAYFMEKLRYKAEKMNLLETPEILLSFLGDVYQPAEMDLMLTRGALCTLIANQLPFTILTKGGTRACRDFDLLGQGKARFGTSLIFMDQKHADYWEPGAAPIKDRIKAIQEAHERKIPTWVSLEPVIEPGEAIKVVRELHPIVRHWKIGKINHHAEIERRHNWIQFREQVQLLLEDVHADYYFKKSLFPV
jgi:DNA repair photolyase